MNTISHFLRYLEDMCGFSARTLKRYSRICGLWIEFLAGKYKEISEAGLEDFLCYIEVRTKKVNNKSLSGELCIIRTFYAFLYNYGILEVNIAGSIPELICEPSAEKSWLTVDECFQFLNAFDTSDPIGLRNYVLSALLWSTGLQNSEICNLDWRDIDLEEGALIVRKGKGGKQRQVFFNERMRKELNRYHERMMGGPSDPVFYALSQNALRKGKHAHLSQSTIVEVIREHGKKAGLKNAVNPLTFRHCFATHMYEAGVTILDIKEMLAQVCPLKTNFLVNSGSYLFCFLLYGTTNFVFTFFDNTFYYFSGKIRNIECYDRKRQLALILQSPKKQG